MKSFVLAWIVSLNLFQVGVQTGSPHGAGEVKQWHLRVRQREVSIRLSARPDNGSGHTVLSLEPNDDFAPTASEEAELLAQVLHEMRSLGYNPRGLEMISTWLQNSEFLEGIQNSVAESGKWKSCARRKYCHEAEGAANHYLHSVNAYKAFDEVLGAYGLKRKSVRVDDLSVAKQSTAVLCSGLIVIALESNR